MNNLKTLKDFKECKYMLSGVCEHCLKAEAIKWIKEWKKGRLKSNKSDSESTEGYVRGWNDGRAELIEDFEEKFNISEEELK